MSKTTIQYITDFLNFSSMIILIIGFVGNIFVFKIYSSPAFTKYTLSTYFCALSIFDSLNLIGLVFNIMFQMFDTDLSQSIDLFCKFQNYWEYIYGPICAWLMAAISLDRYLNIAYPRRFRLLFNRRFQLTFILALTAFNVLIYSYIPWNSGIETKNSSNNETIRSCVIHYDATLLRWFDFTNNPVIPFTFMIGLSMTMIIAIYKSRSRAGSVHNRMGSNNSQKRRDRKFAITTLLLNFIYLVLILPAIIYTDLWLPNLDADIFNFVLYVILQPYFLNYSIGFYTQLAVNSLFRKQFLVILKLKVVSKNDLRLSRIGNGVEEGTSGRITVISLTNLNRPRDIIDRKKSLSTIAEE